MEVGREVCLRKKKNDKKEKGLKKTCKERRPKKKKKDKMVGTFPLSEILNGKRTKILGKHIATFLKTSLFVSPKFFGKYGLSCLKTIVTFSINVAINKKYVTKTVPFAAF